MRNRAALATLLLSLIAACTTLDRGPTASATSGRAAQLEEESGPPTSYDDPYDAPGAVRPDVTTTSDLKSSPKRKGEAGDYAPPPVAPVVGRDADLGVILTIAPMTPFGGPVNCYPFGTNDGQWSPSMGFVYRNIPAFFLNVGDQISFDTRNVNNAVIQRDIFLSRTNINPAPFTGGSQGVRALGWTKVVDASQTPLNPQGNVVVGDFELTWTATASFNFPGGGLAIGFMVGVGAPFDNGCDQMLNATQSSDPSGFFYTRWFRHVALNTTDILDANVGGGFFDNSSLGGFRINGSSLNAPPTVSLSAPASANEGSSLTVTANVADPNNDAVTVEWDFNNDGITDLTNSGVTTPGAVSQSWTYDDNQTATVKVKVNDGKGGIANSTTTIQINNVAPTATFNAPNAAVNEGSSNAVSLTGVSDVSPVDVTAGFEYSFDCGSGFFGPWIPSSTSSCIAVDNPGATWRGRVRDKDGGISEYSQALTINNVAPTAVFAAPPGVNEGTSFSIGLSGVADAGVVDFSLGFQYAFDCGTGYGAYGASTSASCSAPDNGSITVRGKVKDKDGGEGEYIASVVVNNVAPTAMLNAPPSATEGGAFALNLSGVSDPSPVDVSAGFQYAFDCGAGYGAYGPISSAVCPALDNPGVTIRGKVRDKDNGESEYAALVVINNVAPSVGAISAPSFAGIGQTISISASFTDPGTVDNHSASISWGDGTTLATVSESGGSGTASGSHAYAAPGFYTITLTVTDKDGASGSSTFQYVVVVDPSAGSITGGGYIDVGSRVNYGFNAKYQGSTLGCNVTVQLAAGQFKSTSCAWLVVSGNTAWLAGSGTLNGSTQSFLLAITDNGEPGGGDDRIRIQVGGFDTQSGDPITAAPTTPTGNGNLQVHKKG